MLKTTSPNDASRITIAADLEEVVTDKREGRENAPGSDLFAAIEAAVAGEAASVVWPTQCLGVCKRLCTVSLSGEGIIARVPPPGWSPADRSAPA